jgi:uncharacterized protein (TIGR00288 family)
MSRDAVALYWDFENIHASLYDAANDRGAYQKAPRHKAQEVLVDVQTIYDFAATYGNVAINKAYCNWQWYGKYRNSLLKCAVELIQIFPPGASAKNGADIKLSLDAMEDVLRFPHITAVIVVGGDSDFIPLAQKMKAEGRELIGIGCKGATNQHWANSCSEFKYYESIVVEPIVEEPHDSDTMMVKNPVELISKAIKQICAKQGEKWVLKSMIRPVVKRLDPTFDEANYDCKNFNELLLRYPGNFTVRKGAHDHEVCLGGHVQGAAVKAPATQKKKAASGAEPQ